ncbi:general substrate transporter [Dendrothele bispora CBS 962.96]|uniref:General substrate transporter n=1 Tax=Dendrothele bispora (strain CBS 962.96) TaxID=1314807 RepID=A0A4V4HIW6_DENBC|nr:general substrate transporter [Dendrothele bispora CBS 962.96]
MPELQRQADSPVDEKGHEIEHDAKVVEVNNVELAAALEATPLNPRSWSSIKLFLILLVAFMGSLSNGFDGQVMGAVNGMNQYLSYFGLVGKDSGGGVGTPTALIFGIASQIVGVVVAGPLADGKFGRRGGMFIGALIIVVGAIVITAAKNRDYLLAGRFVLGFGVSITTTACPAYVVEMSPPQWRGRLTGLTLAFYYTGSILCTGIAIGTGKLLDTTSWRAPLAIQIAPATVLALFVWFLPESPRWLMAANRPEDARKVLVKYHGAGDENASLVSLEMKEFEESIKIDASDKRWWDYSELVNTRNARYRTFMMLMMGFFGQWSGNGLGYFLTVLFASAGVQSQERRLVLNFVNTIISAIGASIGTSLCDTVGRRKMWFWGTVASASMLVIVTACTAKFGQDGSNPAGANAAIAFIFLFGFVFSFSYTPLQALYPTECLANNTRAKGMAMYSFAVSCAGLVGTYAGPVALQNITWKYYIVYICWDVFEATMIYFFAVETRGRTLEELDEIFEDPNPVKASLRKQKVAVIEKAGKVDVVAVDEA